MKKIIVTLMISMMAFSACSSLSSKPSKQDVKDGFYKIATKELPKSADKDKVKKLSNCVIDEVYDDLSKSSAKAIADGDKDAKGTDKESDKLEAATAKCAKSSL